jgi:ribosomal-protein-alanine N-acetyltransferase
MICFIETERLILRPVRRTDAKDFFELDSNPKVHQYLGNNPLTSLVQSEQVIAHILKQYNDYGIGRLAVILKETEEFVGWAGLKYEQQIRKDFKYYDLGYRLKEQFWGMGIATEAAAAALSYGFSELNLKEICAAADIHNMASNKILNTIGMHLSGTFTYNSSLCNWYTKKTPYE